MSFSPGVITVLVFIIPCLMICAVYITARLSAVLRVEASKIIDAILAWQKNTDALMEEETARLARQIGVRRQLLTSAMAQKGKPVGGQDES